MSRYSICGLTIILLLLPWQAFAQAAGRPQSIQAPVLKWQNGGCFSSWCETGWYSSPAVADLDGDGKLEVIASAYSIVVLEGETGHLLWRMPSGHDRSQPNSGNVGRTWPGIVVADVDGNGDSEIVTAHSGGYVSVYDHRGYFEPGWPQRPSSSELRGLSVYDLDGDDRLEVVVTSAVGSKTNAWVLQHDGSTRPGWPQLVGDAGYAYGVFNDNAAVGDLDGDGQGEIVVPSDVHYVCAYEADGSQIPAHSMYGDKGWGKVGVWESLEIEQRGWGYCREGYDRSERYRPNFAHGPAVMADFDGDGSNEVAVIGNVYDCISGYASKYNGPYLFHADRSRFQSSGYDWRSPPVDTGAPLSENYGIIEHNQPNPAAADLDGDGQKEIVYASYDGRVHAFWLDRTEHGSWPFAIYKAGEGVQRFASEPVIADLDADGSAEVLFASWVQKGSGLTGKLHIVNSMGHPVHEVDLPPAYGSPDWNGGLAAPTLANIDADLDLEVVLNTAHSGFVAYDLPGTKSARILWATGRGNQQRTGSILYGSLAQSSMKVAPRLPEPGDSLAYTIRLDNPGPALHDVRLTNSLPAELTFLGDLWASEGSYGQASGTITWTGSVAAGQPVTITYGVTVGLAAPAAYVLANRAVVEDGQGSALELEARTVVGGFGVYLPLVQRGG